MIEITTHLESWTLDLERDTTIPIEENSKSFDANPFHFDFAYSINLPYSSTNVQLYQKYEFEKFKITLKSDGIFIGNFYAKIKTDDTNLNTFTGSYTLEIFSLFSDLNDTATDAKIRDHYIYEEDIDFTTVNPEDKLYSDEPNMHAWYRLAQRNPNPDKPYRFPEYSIMKDIKDSGDNPYIPDYADTLGEDFGNIILVNHLNYTHPPHTATEPYVRYLVLYDIGNYQPINYNTGTIYFCDGQGNFTKNVQYNQIGEPRRIWGLVCPCFNYIEVLEKCLNHLGYSVIFDWNNADTEAFFKGLYLLNNYNIYNTNIERKEVKAKFDVPPNNPYADLETIVFNYVSPFSSLIFPNNETIDGKNHIPDITILELINDFIVKSNTIVDIEASTIIFREIKIRQSTADIEINPNIKTTRIENSADKVLKYNYPIEDNPQNIPDYRLTTNFKEKEEIPSDIVPAHVIHEVVPSSPADVYFWFSYIIGQPSIDPEKNIEKITYWLTTFHLCDNTESTVPDDDRVTDTKLYRIEECPKYCAEILYDTDILSLYSQVLIFANFFPNLNYVCIASEYHPNLRTLRWETTQGIYEQHYKSTILLLMAKVLIQFSALCTIDHWNSFSHHDYFWHLGKRLFPLRRQYTLPLSLNPLIRYDGYSVL